MQVIKMNKMTNYRQFAIDIGADIAKGPWIAGGAARRLYQNELHVDRFDSGDIDIFLPIENYVEVKDRVELIVASRGFHQSIAERYKDRSNDIRNCRIKLGGIERHVQIIGGGHADLSALFRSFDFTVSQFAASGQFLAFPEHSMDDLKEMRLDLVQPSQPPKWGTPARINKYCFYGFRPAPGILRWATGTGQNKVSDDMRVIRDGNGAY